MQIPKRRKQSSEEEDDYDEGGKDYSKEDALVRESYTEAKTLTTKFLMGLLNKFVLFSPASAILRICSIKLNFFSKVQSAYE